MHFEETKKDLFRDSEFLTLLKQGKEQIKRAVSSSGIHDIFHGMDYKNLLHPGSFLSQLHHISFTINTDGVNKYSSSRAGHLWPVYIMINELPKEAIGYMAIALFGGSFKKQIKCTVCFSLVFACRRNRNFVFRVNIPRRSETC